MISANLFPNKVVLITGASSGIGQAAARVFALNGASVILTGKHKENLQKTVELCEPFSLDNPRTILGAIDSEKDVHKIFDFAIKQYHRLDILVNSAGIMPTGCIEKTCLDQFDRVFQTNLRGMYQLTMLAIPYLIKTEGNIVNVSSIHSTRAFPGFLEYNMSKSAVDQFTRSVAVELGLKGVRVNAVNPGVIVTELQKRGVKDTKDYELYLKRSRETQALGRPGDVEEVANAIAFLASDYAKFITAVTLPVDGGRQVMGPV